VKILVCVKHVPDATAERGFHQDGVTDRESVDAVLSELDEYAVEQALRIAESDAGAEITYVTIGPAAAKAALLKALAMGGDRGVHVVDDRLRGTDAPGTALVLAKAARHLGFDLLMCGMASTDGGMGAVPAMVAEHLGVPAATYLSEIRVGVGSLSGVRETETAKLQVQATLPAVVSVTDRTGEARYPSFKGIVAAKKKPLVSLALDDLGVPPEQVGTTGSRSTVEQASKRPPRTAGEIVCDSGEGGIGLADFLATRKFI
jgi:electron transfer flavoprotein beta subunit